MKLLVVISIIACSYAEQLDRGYLPPPGAIAAGGSPGSLVGPQGPTDQGFGLTSGSDIIQSAGAAGSFGEPAAEYGPPSGAPGSSTLGFTSTQSGRASLAGQYDQGRSGQYKPERARASLDRSADTLRYENRIDGDTFSYSFETTNGISADESGVATKGVQAQGGFAYTADDGQIYRVTYTADENGYQPRGDHLPTSPPIPDEILRSIEQNARAAAAGNQEGAYNPNEGLALGGDQGYQYDNPSVSISRSDTGTLDSVKRNQQGGYPATQNQGDIDSQRGYQTSSSQYNTPGSQYNTPDSQYNTAGSTAGYQYNTPGSTAGTQYNTAGSQYNTAGSTTGSQYNTARSTAGSQYNTPGSTPGTQYNTAGSTAGYQYNTPGSTAGTQYNTAGSTAGYQYNTPGSTAGTQYNTAGSTAGSQYNTPGSTPGTQYNTAGSTAGYQYNTPGSTAGTQYNTAGSTAGSQYNTAGSTTGSKYNTAGSTAGSQYNTPGSTPGTQYLTPGSQYKTPGSTPSGSGSVSGTRYTSKSTSQQYNAPNAAGTLSSTEVNRGEVFGTTQAGRGSPRPGNQYIPPGSGQGYNPSGSVYSQSTVNIESKQRYSAPSAGPTASRPNPTASGPSPSGFAPPGSTAGPTSPTNYQSSVSPVVVSNTAASGFATSGPTTAGSSLSTFAPSPSSSGFAPSTPTATPGIPNTSSSAGVQISEFSKSGQVAPQQRDDGYNYNRPQPGFGDSRTSQGLAGSQRPNSGSKQAFIINVQGSTGAAPTAQAQYQPNQLTGSRTSMAGTSMYEYDRSGSQSGPGGVAGAGKSDGGRSGQFGGPRQPPSFSQDEGYKY